jgi:NDP-mannose synthase
LSKAGDASASVPTGNHAAGINQSSPEVKKVSPSTARSGVHGVLQAGGKGTRLVPATTTVPKPLIKVDGVPMIERLLRQFVDCGIRVITVITGWLGEEVETYLGTLTQLPVDLQLNFIRESRPMGNIGALAQMPPGPEPILFAFGDLVTDLDFGKLLAVHRQMGAQATLASHYESHQLTLGELLVRGSQVTDYQEKPLKKFLICSGIAVFEPPVLELLDVFRPMGISDLIKAALARSVNVAHWTHGAFWIDVNTPQALEIAERQLFHKSASRQVET